jgi:hypothetical protein
MKVLVLGSRSGSSAPQSSVALSADGASWLLLNGAQITLRRQGIELAHDGMEIEL